MRPPRLRCTLFPFIYPPHLLLLPATFGLYLLLQTYPYFRALYVIPVRRTKGLPTASFRFHLTMDTLAVQLYTSSLPRRVRDFHPLERAHGAQTKKSSSITLNDFYFPCHHDNNYLYHSKVFKCIHNSFFFFRSASSFYTTFVLCQIIIP